MMMKKTFSKVLAVVAVGLLGLSTAFAQTGQPFSAILTLDTNGNGKIDKVVLINSGSVGSSFQAGTAPNYDGFSVAGYTFSDAAPTFGDFEGDVATMPYADALRSAGVTGLSIAGAGYQDVFLSVTEKATFDGDAKPQVTYNANTGQLAMIGGGTKVGQIETFTLEEQDGVFVSFASACTGDADADGRIDQVKIKLNGPIATTGFAGSAFADMTAAPAPAHSVTGGGIANDAGVGVITLNINEAYPQAWTGEALTMVYTAGNITDQGGLRLLNNFRAPLSTATNFAVADCVAPFVTSAETNDTNVAGGTAGVTHIAGSPNMQGNGKIDTYTVTYSEVVTLPALADFKAATSISDAFYGAYTVASFGASTLESGPHANLANRYTKSVLNLTEKSTPDTDSTPSFTYTNQATASKRIVDAVSLELAKGGNTEASSTASSVTFPGDDDAPPAIVDICALDTNKDGYIDALEFLYSEKLGNNLGLYLNAKASAAAARTDEATKGNAKWSQNNFLVRTNDGTNPIAIDHAYTQARPDDRTIRVFLTGFDKSVLTDVAGTNLGYTKADATGEAATYHTDYMPQSRYLADGNSEDIGDRDPVQTNQAVPDGFPAPGRELWLRNATDKAAPVAMYAGTVDQNANGKLDGYYIIFSEPVDGATVGAQGTVTPAFSVDGYGTVSVNVDHPKDANDNDNVVFVSFAEGSNYDTGAIPAINSGSSINLDLLLTMVDSPDLPQRGGQVRVKYDGSAPMTIEGTFSNLATSFTKLMLEDAANAANNKDITSAVTGVAAVNGRGGSIFATVPVDAALKTALQNGTVSLKVYGTGTPAPVELSVALTGTNIKDFAGNAMVSVSDAMNNTLNHKSGTPAVLDRLFDDAEPVLVRAVGQVGFKRIRVTFSETVKEVGAAEGNFTYTNDGTPPGTPTPTHASAYGGGAIAFTAGSTSFTIENATNNNLIKYDVLGDVLGIVRANITVNNNYVSDMAGTTAVSGRSATVTIANTLNIPNLPTDRYGATPTVAKASGVAVVTAMQITGAGQGGNPIWGTAASSNDRKGNITNGVDISINDPDAPKVVASWTLDRNSDGKVDLILVKLDEEIDDNTVDASKFTVAGYTVNSFIKPATAGGANDPRTYYWSNGAENTATTMNQVDQLQDEWIALNVEKTGGAAEGDTDAKPQVTNAAGAVSDFNSNQIAANSTGVASMDYAGPAIVSANIIGPNTFVVNFSENVSGIDNGDILFDMNNTNSLPAPANIIAVNVTARAVTYTTYPINLFMLAPSNNLKVSLSSINKIKDLNGTARFNLQNGAGAAPTATLNGPNAGKVQAGDLVRTVSPITACGATGPALVAGTNGAVVSGEICRSTNDPFHPSYQFGATKVARYEIYMTKGGVTTLVAQFAPPSTGSNSTTGTDKFAVTFAVAPTSGTVTFGVAVVGENMTKDDGVREAGNNYTLATGAASNMVAWGTVNMTDDVPPANVGKDLSIVDGDAGKQLVASFTSSDHGRFETYGPAFGTSVGNTVTVYKVTEYKVYDAAGTLVATVPVTQAIVKDGKVSITFEAPAFGDGNYTVKASDGINVSEASNAAAGLAIGGTVPGDANGDGKVNVQDLAVFAQTYGATAGAGNYTKSFDFDNNGSIGLADYARFAKLFGTGAALGKTEQLPATSAKLSVEVKGNLAYVRANGLANVQGFQFDIAVDGGEVVKVQDGAAFKGNSLSVASGNTYAVASTAGAVENGVIAVIELSAKAKSVKLSDIIVVEARAAKGADEVTGVGIPSEFALDQNYPNPFNPTTAIRFSLPENANVKLQIFDMTGRLVKTMVAGQVEAGVHTMTWNATDNAGAPVASGVYLYRIQAGNFVKVNKMTLLK